MNDSEFILYTDQLFEQIMTQVDDLDADFDCLIAGNVLTIEYDDGSQIVINRHLASQELWLATKMGGYHFLPNEKQWLDKKGNEFYSILSQSLSDLANEEMSITP